MVANCRRYVVQTWKGIRSFHSSVSTAGRGYAEAVVALNSLQSNAAFLDALRASGSRAHIENAIPEMIDWCQRAGFAPADLDRLNAIHIAGTKGKGSTSAFVSSILRQYTDKVGTEGSASNQSPGPTKLGLYTSPHLRFVRERIQIDGAPLCEQDFADAFFGVWDQLDESAKMKPFLEGEPKRPMYFRYLTMMAYRSFLQQGVDTAIVECGIGGEHDSTNVLVRPSVTGITSLGIDHQVVLGSTLEEIAWHKAGIMKAGVPAFTMPQPENAMRVLNERAVEKEVELKIVDMHPDIASGRPKLGLAGEFQKGNASLAVELAAAQLKAFGHENISTDRLNDKFIKGLRDAMWGGRCETREEKDSGITWYIDGAHTLESIEAASEWFAECLQERDVESASNGKRVIRVLLFNQATRTGAPLLKKLNDVVSSKTGIQGVFQHAVFCTNITFDDSGYRLDLVNTYSSTKSDFNLDIQNSNADAWESIDSGTQVQVFKTIEHAVDSVRRISTEAGGRDNVKVQVFVVGSLHLVGGALEVLETNVV